MTNVSAAQIGEWQSWAKAVGTPGYFFDNRILQRRVRYLRSMLPQNVHLCYAVKANTFITGLLCGVVERFEACSEGEARICLATPVPEGTLVVSGVNKDAAYMDELVRTDVPVARYTVESRSQFDMLLASAREHGKRIPLLLRLTSGNQFGLDKAELAEIVANFVHDPAVEICGIQYFSGTQKTSIKRLARELRQVRKMIDKLAEDYGFACAEVEFGPGFPVAYFNDESFDEDAYLREFAGLLEDFAFTGPIHLELGRSIAASCGSYLTAVADAKVNAGQPYAIADGGMNHLVYFGQSLAMRQPCCVRVPMGAPAFLEGRTLPAGPNGEEPGWCVCGSLCSVNDIMVKQLVEPQLAVGDVLAFQHTGAYCMTEGISLFLSRDLPCVHLVDEDGRINTVRSKISTFPFNASFCI